MDKEYLTLAIKASEAEQEFNYKRAITLWQCASHVASDINFDWCEKRIAFCEVWQLRLPKGA
ncbi:ANR family transcriptional regulator [Shewanella halifaxensis]|uniref:ANR family transcriptional regulator n=1 Tax=Shewanella halifaxensis TaxID=271098 RepID=UPI000D59FEDF|nr:ANR family transcriptional regulator [Shewanella halifaxensis]